MEVVLIIVIALLFVLAAVVGLSGRGARRAARGREQDEARVTSENAKVQQERSAAGQADVKAAHAERTSKLGHDTDD